MSLSLLWRSPGRRTDSRPGCNKRLIATSLPTRFSMKREIRKISQRYGVALAAFLLPLIISVVLKRLSITVDLTLLVIGAIIAAAWYGGTVPGLMVALLFELVALAQGNPRGVSTPRFMIAELNRTALLVILVLLVSSRRKAESRVREQREWLEVTLSSIADAVIATDLSGRISFMNPISEALTGWAFLEAKEKPLSQVFRIVNKEIYHETRDNIFSPNEDKSVDAVSDVILTSRDGTDCSICYSSAPIRNRAGDVTGSVLVFRDVTEHIQLQDQFRQAQKMEAIGRLAGGIAHDFNNLLTAIIGYSDLLLSEVGNDARLRAQIEEIGGAGRRAAVLTSQLLTFSRKQVRQPKVLDLNEVIIGIEKMLRHLIGEDIDMQTITRSGLARIKADPGQIEQILLNLAVNSRDAMPNGGKLTIESAAVDLDEAYAHTHADIMPGRYVMLAVSDTGHGMDDETKSRIFEPFFTTKEQGKGTGLGLSTVFGIVKQSGGHIWVYSEPGHGVVFKIYFPRVDAVTESLAEEAESAASRNGTETILLVEDDESVRELSRSILQRQGYTVLASEGAATALKAFGTRDSAVDLVITDVVMPQMSGADLVAELKQRHSTVKVLYVSGYTEEATIHRGVIEKGVNFLQKPFTPDSLARKVRQVLDRCSP